MSCGPSARASGLALRGRGLVARLGVRTPQHRWVRAFGQHDRPRSAWAGTSKEALCTYVVHGAEGSTEWLNSVMYKRFERFVMAALERCQGRCLFSVRAPQGVRVVLNGLLWVLGVERWIRRFYRNGSETTFA
jgi:hypothetical protein